ncbi:high affinity immunoglobulin epsilon receptor subunit gamma [Hipposideros larvatus]
MCLDRAAVMASQTASPKVAVPVVGGGRALVTVRLRRKSPVLSAPLVGPSGSRLVSAGRGRGQSWGKAWQEGGNSVVRELLAEHSRAVPSQRPIPARGPHILPRMRPAVAFVLLLLAEQAAALAEPQLCYILDSILFVYGIVLTVLYCRLKIQVRKAAVSCEKSDGIYTGLSTRNQETYETLKHEKPPQ